MPKQEKATSKEKQDEKVSSKDTIQETTKERISTETGFFAMNLKKELLNAIKENGFEKPSEIQEITIPHILEGKDVLAQAQTGTGKTAAFALPILNKLNLNSREIQALVITPTRELAMQVNNEFNNFGKQLGVSSACIYGGADYSKQLRDVRGAKVIVATPGRLIDLLQSKRIKINPNFIVLDEADEMLDMGFLDDIKKIFSFLGDDQQRLLFSATIPKAIVSLSAKILKSPEIIQIVKEEKTNADIKQSFYVVDMRDKKDAIIRLFEYKEPEKSIVFCKMKKDVDVLVTHLVSSGFNAKGLHGDMAQAQRGDVISAFRAHKVNILIATDVAARGLDISDVSHVFNYSIPFDTQGYVHRIGRTGRAGKKGKAVSIVTPNEYYLLQKIKKETNSLMESMAIPSLKELLIKKQSTLIDKLQSQEIRDDVYEIYDKLSEKFQPEQICYKLFSLLFDANKTQRGRDKIGKSIEDINYLEKKGNNRGDSRGGRGRDGGRSRRSSFGGNRSRVRGNSDNRDRSSFGGGNRDRQEGGYNRDRSSFGGGNRDRQEGGYNRDRSSFGGGNRDRQEGGYNRDRGGFGGRGNSGNRDRQEGGYNRDRDKNEFGKKEDGDSNNNRNRGNFNRGEYNTSSNNRSRSRGGFNDSSFKE